MSVIPESITQYLGEAKYSALVLVKDPVETLKGLIQRFDCHANWATWGVDFPSGARISIGRLPLSTHTIYRYSGSVFHSIYVAGDIEEVYYQELRTRLRRWDDQDPIPLQFQVVGCHLYTKGI